MYRNLAEILATLLSANKIIEIDEQEAYSYGLELFFFKFTLYIIILIISLITNSFLISFIFTISYVLLRQYTGGYHCKSSESCMVISIIIYMLMLFLYNMEAHSYGLLSIVLTALSYSVIILKAPIENENNPLDSEEIKRYRILSIILSSILIILFFMFSFFDFKDLFFPISYALTADAVLILISPRRNKNEKGNS